MSRHPMVKSNVRDVNGVDGLETMETALLSGDKSDNTNFPSPICGDTPRLYE